MQARVTQAKPPSREGKIEAATTPTIPLKTQFEQLQSSEQGLTGEEASQRLEKYGPTDHVDPSFIQKPQHWDINLISKFMIVIGPISSIFDFLTFFILLRVFHAGPVLFHTGWFVESLSTQTLVLFIIRTAGNPLRSLPSLLLTMTVLLVVAIGLLLPYTPLAGPLGFTPLPGLYFLFLIAMTVTYLLLVELVKRPLMRRYAQ